MHACVCVCVCELLLPPSTPRWNNDHECMTALTLNRREGKPYRETIPSHPRCALTHTPPSAFCPKTTFARHDALDYLHVISFLLLLLLILILSLLLPISFGVPACTGTHKHTQGHTPMTGCCRCRAPLHFAPVSAQQRLGSARLKRRRERERKKKEENGKRRDYFLLLLAIPSCFSFIAFSKRRLLWRTRSVLRHSGTTVQMENEPRGNLDGVTFTHMARYYVRRLVCICECRGHVTPPHTRRNVRAASAGRGRCSNSSTGPANYFILDGAWYNVCVCVSIQFTRVTYVVVIHGGGRRTLMSQWYFFYDSISLWRQRRCSSRLLPKFLMRSFFFFLFSGQQGGGVCSSSLYF